MKISYDVIYVNGSNNVPNLRKDSDTWKVRLIEEEFRARMWEGVWCAKQSSIATCEMKGVRAD